MRKMTKSQKYNLIVWSFVALLSLGALLKLGGNIKLLGIASVFCIIAVVIHYKRALKDDNYLKYTIGIVSKNQRHYEYDYLRTLAAMMVIVTHAVQIDIALGFVEE